MSQTQTKREVRVIALTLAVENFKAFGVSPNEIILSAKKFETFLLEASDKECSTK